MNFSTDFNNFFPKHFETKDFFGNFGHQFDEDFCNFNKSFDNFNLHDNFVVRPDLKFLQKQDESILSHEKESILEGYLNLTTAEGWKESGNDGRVGAAFTRFILVNYFITGKEQQALAFNEPILENVINSFTNIGIESFPSDRCQPKTSRSCYDFGVTGWQKHRVSRMVGNLGSQYDPAKPFFEILINSQGDSRNDICNPFFITIHENEKALDERGKLLGALKIQPSEVAHPFYYSSLLKKQDAYLAEKQGKLGPNSTHLLKGLEFLAKQQLSAQKAGNCWIKQPMRCLLASLFIEFYTNCEKTPTPELAWTQAKDVYKRIQKTVAVPYVENLLNNMQMTSQMRYSAIAAIEKQKAL